MRLRGKLTDQELEEAGSFLRRWWYWPRILVSNLHGVLLVGVLLWASVANLLHSEDRRWDISLGILFAILLVFAGCWWSARRELRKERAAFNAALPDQFDVESAGLRLIHASDAELIYPWSVIRRWRPGKSVMLLDLEAPKVLLLLPLSDLTDVEREMLHGLFTGRLGPAGDTTSQ